MISTIHRVTSNELTYNELADGSKEIATINGVKLNWVQVENEGNAYQTKLDEALKGQQDSTEKVDMFLMEADYALKYANGDVALSIQDLGITDDDMSQMYQYTKDVATDTKTGELKGVSWQATPGLFLYNTKIAEDVLGTKRSREGSGSCFGGGKLWGSGGSWESFQPVPIQTCVKTTSIHIFGSGFAA